MPEDPLAYFITIRAYGAWLHGDQHGSMDRHHNAWDSPPLPPNPRIEHSRGVSLKSWPVAFDATQRAVIADTVAEVCAHRDWELLALNVRTNHAHVVVGAGVPPDQVMTAFKSWSTRRMLPAGLLQRGSRAWSRHGSTRYLWTEKQVEAASSYVVDEQGASLD
jgi:REP element-mobilizing transposase RayT